MIPYSRSSPKHKVKTPCSRRKETGIQSISRTISLGRFESSSVLYSPENCRLRSRTMDYRFRATDQSNSTRLLPCARSHSRDRLELQCGHLESWYIGWLQHSSVFIAQRPDCNVVRLVHGSESHVASHDSFRQKLTRALSNEVLLRSMLPTSRQAKTSSSSYTTDQIRNRLIGFEPKIMPCKASTYASKSNQAGARSCPAGRSDFWLVPH